MYLRICEHVVFEFQLLLLLLLRSILLVLTRLVESCLWAFALYWFCMFWSRLHNSINDISVSASNISSADTTFLSQWSTLSKLFILPAFKRLVAVIALVIGSANICSDGTYLTRIWSIVRRSLAVAISLLRRSSFVALPEYRIRLNDKLSLRVVVFITLAPISTRMFLMWIVRSRECCRAKVSAATVDQAALSAAFDFEEMTLTFFVALCLITNTRPCWLVSSFLNDASPYISISISFSRNLQESLIFEFPYSFVDQRQCVCIPITIQVRECLLQLYAQVRTNKGRVPLKYVCKFKITMFTISQLWANVNCFPLHSPRVSHWIKIVATSGPIQEWNSALLKEISRTSRTLRDKHAVFVSLKDETVSQYAVK